MCPSIFHFPSINIFPHSISTRLNRPSFNLFVLFCSFLKQGLTSPGCSPVALSQLTAALTTPGSNNPPISASQIAGNTGPCHHAQLIFVFFVEVGFRHVAQASLKLLGSSDPTASASQISGITVRPITHSFLLQS